MIKGVGDTPNQHDILTGSQLDGTAFTDGADHTCNNWTSNATGTAQLGHADRTGGGNNVVEFDASEPWLQPGESGQHRRRGLCCIASR